MAIYFMTLEVTLSKPLIVLLM